MGLRSGFDLEKFPDLRPPGVFVLVLGLGAWSMVDHAKAHLGMAPCPVCEGRPLRRHDYCIGCDRSGIDFLVSEGRVELPGLDVDYAPDPEWAAEPTAYRPGRLDGGKGRRKARAEARRRAGSRARRAG